MADSTIHVGHYRQVSATEINLPPGSPAPVYVWSSDNPGVAAASSLGGNGQNGRVDGVSAGTANIACTDTANNLHASHSVEIDAIPPSLDFGFGVES
jgi:uncharacterized protein YjdB